MSTIVLSTGRGESESHMLSRATVTVAGLCGRNETKLEGSPSAVRSAEPIAKREAGAARGLARETEAQRADAPAPRRYPRPSTELVESGSVYRVPIL